MVIMSKGRLGFDGEGRETNTFYFDLPLYSRDTPGARTMEMPGRTDYRYRSGRVSPHKSTGRNLANDRITDSNIIQDGKEDGNSPVITDGRFSRVISSHNDNKNFAFFLCCFFFQWSDD